MTDDRPVHITMAGLRTEARFVLPAFVLDAGTNLQGGANHPCSREFEGVNGRPEAERGHVAEAQPERSPAATIDARTIHASRSWTSPPALRGAYPPPRLSGRYRELFHRPVGGIPARLSRLIDRRRTSRA